MNINRSNLQRHHGFTLIELMVVLVIIGIVLLVGVLALSGFGLTAKMKESAQQLQEVMTVASQQAMLQPAIIGMKITNKGYHFYRSEVTGDFGQSTWVKLYNDQLSRRNAFGDDLNVEIKSKRFQGDADDADKPQLVFYPSGFVTPAIITLKAKGKTGLEPYQIKVFQNGTITVGQKSDT